MGAAIAGIGHNNPPPDEEDDKSPPTVEEARIVYSAIRYVQWKVSELGLDDFLVKRKGGARLGWRLALSNALKERVRQNSLSQLLSLNRKTAGENQQRPDAWAEHDDEEGTGEFGMMMAQLRDAIMADSHIDAVAITAKLKWLVKIDPKLRTMEEQRRLHEAAAEEAERAARALEESARERKREQDRARRAKEVAKLLKGSPNKRAIVAENLGPKGVTKMLSEDALSVVELLVKSDKKGVRRSAGQVDSNGVLVLDPNGLKECRRWALVIEARPHLAPVTDDPPLAPTDLCRRVFVEAVEQGRIKVKPKAKRAKVAA